MARATINRATKFFLLYLIVPVVCFELALWILGYRPYGNTDFKIVATPNNPYTGSDSLGFKLNPGTYRITLKDSLSFIATHQENGMRFTANAHSEMKNNLHFFGCSFTYGYGVDDERNFSALIQQGLDTTQVQNHGVVGYGTVQSYLQLLKSSIQKGDVVVLVLSSQHLIRNTLSQTYRSHLKIGFENSSQQLEKNMQGARFPYLPNCEVGIQFDKWNELYSNYRGRDVSSLVNFIQTTYDNLQNDNGTQINATACLIKWMSDHCTTQKAQFMVACLDKSKATESVRNLIPNIYWTNLDFSFKNKDHINYPYDEHPNQKGHIYIAKKIKAALGAQNN